MRFAGVIVPTVTPLTATEELDAPALQRQVERLIAAGVSGIFVLGSTGEYASLTPTTREAMIARTVEVAAGRLPVLAGVSAPGTAECLQNVRSAQRHGADAIVVSPGFYHPHTGDELEAHFRAVADAAQMPLVLYNIPQRTKVEIPLRLVERLVGDGIASGIKDSSGNTGYFTRLLEIRAAHPEFALLQGDDNQAVTSVALGADGVVPGMGNLAPRLLVEMVAAAGRGDLDEAFACQQRLRPLKRVLTYGSPYAGLKEALHQLGICGPQPAEPAVRPTAEQKRAIADLLREAGIEPLS